MNGGVISRLTLWLSLGVWIGSWGFFAFVTSRVAFEVLPGDVAGDVAGMLLGRLHWIGALCGVLAAIAAARLGRRGWLVWLPVVLAVACAASEFLLSPAVAAVRPSTIGAASTAETANHFRVLHAASLGLFMLVHAASCALLVQHVRLDAREGRG